METKNEEQLLYWNELAAPAWVDMQPLLDAQIAPLGLRGLDVLAPQPGEAVLDVGCGCGDTTLQIAARVAPGGRVLGVDLSAPMLDVARARAAASGFAAASFRQADAQVAQFDAPFDAAFSRFGVMFFADPVAAFANIRAALRPGGRLGFICWREAAANHWMMVPLAAATKMLPPQPPSDPLAPGPFAFADAGRVRTILDGAGFRAVRVEALDMPIGGLSLDQATELALRAGPLGRVLREMPEQRANVAGAVREALARHDSGQGISLPAAAWRVTASN